MSEQWTGIYLDVYNTMYQVTSADAAYHYLRDMGYSYTRAEVRDAWRTVGERDYWSRVINTYGLDRTIPPAWFTPTEANLSAQYQYILKVYATEQETGARIEFYMSYLSNRRVSFGDVISALSDWAEQYCWEENATLDDIEAAGVLKRMD